MEKQRYRHSTDPRVNLIVARNGVEMYVGHETDLSRVEFRDGVGSGEIALKQVVGVNELAAWREAERLAELKIASLPALLPGTKPRGKRNKAVRDISQDVDVAGGLW